MLEIQQHGIDQGSAHESTAFFVVTSHFLVILISTAQIWYVSSRLVANSNYFWGIPLLPKYLVFVILTTGFNSRADEILISSPELDLVKTFVFFFFFLNISFLTSKMNKKVIWIPHLRKIDWSTNSAKHHFLNQKYHFFPPKLSTLILSFKNQQL